MAEDLRRRELPQLRQELLQRIGANEAPVSAPALAAQQRAPFAAAPFSPAPAPWDLWLPPPPGIWQLQPPPPHDMPPPQHRPAPPPQHRPPPLLTYEWHDHPPQHMPPSPQQPPPPASGPTPNLTYGRHDAHARAAQPYADQYISGPAQPLYHVPPPKHAQAPASSPGGRSSEAVRQLPLLQLRRELERREKEVEAQRYDPNWNEEEAWWVQQGQAVWFIVL